MEKLTLDKLTAAVKTKAALRCTSRLVPAGGPGDKVFPPTYEGGMFAFEERIIDGKRVRCVIVDSVASQANRMELALLEAANALVLPNVRVKFSGDLEDIGAISAMEAPHRLADAILRDSRSGDKAFKDTAPGQALETASPKNATGLYRWCPTALIYGLWHSTGARGGLGAKFQRCVVSEIVGIDVQPGIKTSSRIDPLGIEKGAGPLFETKDGGWTLDPKKALKDGKDAKKLGKDGKPSEANHGNIAPTLSADTGGVTLDHALLTTVVSLPALRRLHFPLGDKRSAEVDVAAQTVLAAVALAGAVLAQAKGLDLRSRCLLLPAETASWEVLGAADDRTVYSLGVADAVELVQEATKTAEKVGLTWEKEGLELTPSPDFTELVARSRKLASASIATEE